MKDNQGRDHDIDHRCRTTEKTNIVFVLGRLVVFLLVGNELLGVFTFAAQAR